MSRRTDAYRARQAWRNRTQRNERIRLGLCARCGGEREVIQQKARCCLTCAAIEADYRRDHIARDACACGKEKLARSPRCQSCRLLAQARQRDDAARAALLDAKNGGSP